MAGRRGGYRGMKSHYVCLPLSVDCIAGLCEVQGALSSDAKKLGLLRRGVRDAHFTIGVYSISEEMTKESAEGIVESINERLEDFLHKHPTVELTFGDIGAFGSQFVYINIMNVEELEALRQNINKMLKEEGINLADERFTPHVTLFTSRKGRGGGWGGRGGGWGGRGGGWGGRGGGWGGRRRGLDKEMEAILRNMLTRNDLPPVAPSPVTKIAFRKLLR